VAATAVAVAALALALEGEARSAALVVVLALTAGGLALALADFGRWRSSAAASERRIAELAAARGLLDAITESADVGLGLAETDGRWIEGNARLAALLGRTKEEMRQTTLPEIAEADDRQAVVDALGMLVTGDLSRWTAEVEQVRRDGTTVPVSLLLVRLPNAVTGRAALLVQEIDLTARRRTEAMRECVAGLRQIMVGSLSADVALPQVLGELCKHLGFDVAGHWALDPDAGALRLRHTFHAGGPKLEGFVAAGRDLEVGPGTPLVGRVWQSGVAGAEADLAHVAGYPLATALTSAELRSAVAFPVIDGGDVIGVIELVSSQARTAQDDEVTMLSTAGVEIGQFIRRAETAVALRRSEADHRAIFERSPIGIARVGAGGELLEANASLLAMLEHDLVTMRDVAWPQLLRAYDGAAARDHKRPFLAGAGDLRSVQLRAATGRGRWLWLQLTATPIPDATGEPSHVLVMVEDVTAVRETSDRLAEALEAQREANANLARLDRTKSEFLSIVSHEFRTALTGIQGFSELIRDGGLEADEVRAYGGYIFNDADRVSRLIGDMLDLDRMESGRMSMRTAEVDVNDLLMEAISRAAAPAANVEFKSDLDPRLPSVTGDRDRLIQVVTNIVNNAVKYSPDGGTVTLSSRIEGGYALVSVSDTGIGIPADEIGHVFERFRRVRTGAAQSIPGTGLGLTIVKQIVEMHGGKIWVESAVGHGSSFHFTLPLSARSAPMHLRHA
jgi:PAS domain S-box-containing protein